jgi:FtsP/CotA-like multicopper oxidase with cupredoxin domain
MARGFWRLHSIVLIASVAAAPGADAAPTMMRILANPPAAKPVAPHVYDLNVQMTDSQLYNPATGQNDKVHLRTYWMNAGGMRPDSPLVGPTIDVRPGETFKVNLHNKLPGPAGCHPGPDHNVPNCFDITNFHTHGLWVSPSGNSDNVMLEIDAGKDFDFQFDVPVEHPAGTFWYHSHRHGSTALQVSSGMSGAIIIRGDRKPTLTQNGDIDTLLAPIAPKERIMLFQQIAYACGTKDGQPDWNCTGKTGTINSYSQISGGKWRKSGRFTSINGQILPAFPEAKVGQIERWRMIHGGIASTINVFIRGMKASAPSPDRLNAEQNADWVAQNCTGDVVHQFVIASDGLTRSRIVDRGNDKVSVLQPGYRDDVLVVYPHPGKYCVIDTAAPASESVSQMPESRQLLGLVDVAAGAAVSAQRAYLEQQLVAAAGKAYTPDVASKVKADLVNGMRLTMFQPHKSLLGETNVGHQELAFFMDDDATEFAVATKFDGSNAIPYDGRMSRTLILGTTDEWKMTTTGYDHPFHMHVNPIQVVKILNAEGVDVSESGEPDDPEYADLKGEWKDTLFIKEHYTVVARAHYARFDGVFVLHCHILDHEDKGMMEKIQICKESDKACLARGKEAAMPMHAAH